MRKAFLAAALALACCAASAWAWAAPSLLQFEFLWTAEDVHRAVGAGADVNERGANRITPLMVASKKGAFPEAIEALLVAGAYINARDSAGWSALMYAIRYNPNPEIAALLIERGSSIAGRLGDMSLLAYCLDRGMGDRVVRLLTEAGAEAHIYKDGYKFDTLKRTIVGYEGTGTVVNIPATIGGKDVEAIGQYAFYGNGGIREVAIPEGVASLGKLCFAKCEQLVKVAIPASASYIGPGAFGSCARLAEVAVSGNNAFYSSGAGGELLDKTGTKLLACPGGRAGIGYSIPDGIAEIGTYALYGCAGLESMLIPDGVTGLGDFAFFDCDALRTVSIPGSVLAIGTGAFSSCAALEAFDVAPASPSFSSAGGVLFDKGGETVIAYPQGRKGGQYEVSDGVLHIGAGAFFECRQLAEIAMPGGVSSIGKGAFTGCSGLVRMTLPDSLGEIAGEAFSGCTGLQEIALGRNLKSIGDFAFSACSSLVNLTVPEGAESIGDYAFAWCSKLKNVVVPGSVNSIGEDAFVGCGARIIGSPGSFAEDYAGRKKIPFTSLADALLHDDTKRPQ